METKPNRRSLARVLAIGLLIVAVCVTGYMIVRPDPPAEPETMSRDSVSPERRTGELAPGSIPGSSAGDAARDEQDDPLPEGSAEGTWAVTVLGPEDRPLPDACVRHHANAARFVTTGADGRAVLTWDAEAETTKVLLSGRAPRGVHELTKPETTLRFPDLIPLVVVVIDGVTGNHLPGAQVGLAGDGLSVPFDVAGTRHSLVPSPLRRGGRQKFQIHVTPPRGFVLERPSDLTVLTTVSRFTKTARLPVVVRPEANVVVGVMEHDGTPYAGARIEGVRLGGIHRAFTATPTGANGETMIRGLPALWGNRLWVTVVADERRVELFGYVGPDGSARLQTRLPREKSTGSSSSSSIIGLGGGAGGAFGGRGGRYHESVPPGDAWIRVLRRNGAAAVGARVKLTSRTSGTSRSGRADRDGVVLFKRLVPGKFRVSVSEPGYLDAPREFEVLSGETVRITVTEPEGLALEVVALFHDGRPIPYARIDVAPGGRTPYPILEDDVQMLRLFTDTLGRITIRHLPPGSVRITASYGHRSAQKNAESGGLITIEVR